MSSDPPTSVPMINSIAASPTPPEKPPQSPGEYFSSRSRTPGPSQSPGNNTTSPAPLSKSSTLLQTPPISESKSRQDRGSYFPFQSARSASRYTRTTSPDNHTTPSLSPGLSSGGSFHSSDTGQSPCSYSSSEYLSPPRFQPDGDKPPYVPRRDSSDSLSMIKKKLRRADTIPNDKKIKVKRRHRRRHGCQHHRSKRQEQHQASCWGEPSCQVAPTALTGHKELCSGHAGHFVPKNTQHGSTDTFGRLMAHSMPGPAPPVVARRWSSVEVGAHRIGPQSTLQNPTPQAVGMHGSKNKDQQSDLVPKNLSHGYRSSSFTRDTINHDIVRTVREKLTLRKVVSNQSENPVEPPLSITLRRASGASSISALSGRATTCPVHKDFHSGGESGGATPIVGYQISSQNGESSAAYLITSEDIESITLLIADNLGHSRRTYSRNWTLGDNDPPEQPSCITRAPTISSSGTRQPNTLSAESTIILADFQPMPSETTAQGDYLQVKGLQKPIQRSGSNTSIHEVLWKVSKQSTRSFGSSAYEDDGKACDTSSSSGTSPQSLPEKGKKKPAADKGNAFDPNNARESINEWSWTLPKNDITMMITSSDSDSNDAPPRTKTISTKSRLPLRSTVSSPRVPVAPRVRPFPRYAASHEQLQDVVSFPPLSPRKATNEWFSPLPDMETTSKLSTPSPTTARPLYNLGVDVTTGPSCSAMSKAPFASWVRSAEVSPSQSPGVEFRPDYGFGALSSNTRINDSRRRSVIRPHPKATARTGQSLAMGSSIGVHSSERRKSSAPRVQRVRTIDNIHKGERDGHASRWRPPSICPPRLSPSQLSSSSAEPEESKERRSEERVPDMMTRLHRLRSGITDRISLVEAKSPQLPKSDCAGIYGTITGTLRRSIAAPYQDDTSKHTCDECANDPRSPSIDWIG
ncbi:hypothetical protein BKA65DRAFT_567533 [Rhexocercosporidium sp. MPI-PUGE-AT-0058]|nr:hypothetical protein BKA65DRAFT_567533 [Rhexocercosporidium sp. MPI-PUGE-AT-0058]